MKPSAPRLSAPLVSILYNAIPFHNFTKSLITSGLKGKGKKGHGVGSLRMWPSAPRQPVKPTSCWSTHAMPQKNLFVLARVKISESCLRIFQALIMFESTRSRRTHGGRNVDPRVYRTTYIHYTDTGQAACAFLLGWRYPERHADFMKLVTPIPVYRACSMLDSHQFHTIDLRADVYFRSWSLYRRKKLTIPAE